MSEPVSTNKSEPSPYEKMQRLAAQVMAVPKVEIDRREAAWKQARAAKRAAKK